MRLEAAICSHAGCERSRARFSAFCDDHHLEQLAHAGLSRRPPQMPAEHLRDRCESLIRHESRGTITRDELLDGLFIVLLHGYHTYGGDCWKLALTSMTRPLLDGLEGHVRNETKPLLLRPVADEEERRIAEANSLAAGERLLAALTKCAHGLPA